MSLRAIDASAQNTLNHLWSTVADDGRPGMAQAWCRAFSRCGVACALELHVQQLPKCKRTAGTRPLNARN